MASESGITSKQRQSLPEGIINTSQSVARTDRGRGPARGAGEGSPDKAPSEQDARNTCEVSSQLRGERIQQVEGKARTAQRCDRWSDAQRIPSESCNRGCMVKTVRIRAEGR